MAAAGALFGMVHKGLDIRRIEAGILNAAPDFERTMNPFEAGLSRFVDLANPDLIGKAALAFGSRGRRLLGLRCAGVEPQIGSTVSLDGTDIGHVCAGSWSP